MVKIISAKTAGYRLASIIAVLLIPILYLGANIGLGLRSDLNRLTQETNGADYLNLISPIMVDAAAHDVSENSKSAMIKFSPPISQDIGLAPQNNNLLMSLSYKNPSYDAILTQAVALALETGKNSGISYDADPESYHVGIINSEDLPRVVADFYHLKIEVLDATSKVTDQNSNLITQAIGNLSSSLWRLQASIASAQQKSSNPDYYLAIIDRTAR